MIADRNMLSDDTHRLFLHIISRGTWFSFSWETYKSDLKILAVPSRFFCWPLSHVNYDFSDRFFVCAPRTPTTTGAIDILLVVHILIISSFSSLYFPFFLSFMLASLGIIKYITLPSFFLPSTTTISGLKLRLYFKIPLYLILFDFSDVFGFMFVPFLWYAQAPSFHIASSRGIHQRYCNSYCSTFGPACYTRSQYERLYYFCCQTSRNGAIRYSYQFGTSFFNCLLFHLHFVS